MTMTLSRGTQERRIPTKAPDRNRSAGSPDVIITTRWEAARWCHQFDSVLTVFSPWYYCDWGHRDHKIVEFNDRVRYEDGAPTIDQIDDILTWAESRRDNRMLIHCKAGQSRSTATAIAINAMWGYDEAEAFRLARDEYRPIEKLDIRPFIPNEKVLQHADALLGTYLEEYANGFCDELGGYSEGADW